MSLTAGVLSQVAVFPTEAQLSATAATGGTGAVTYQWYRSTTSGFTPGGGNIIAGATALTLDDTGLIPSTTYYYKLQATDTVPATVTYTQLAVVTSAPAFSPNQFAQTNNVGQLDLKLSPATVSAQIDSTQAGTLLPGAALKVVDSAGGVPKLVGCTANSDKVWGFLNTNFINQGYAAGASCEVSRKNNVMFLYATTPVARGASVSLDLSTNGGVRALVTGDRIVGEAYDKATVAGDLIRVWLTVPDGVLAP